MMKKVVFILSIFCFLSCDKKNVEQNDVENNTTEIKKDTVVEQPEAVYNEENILIYTVQIAALANENTSLSGLQNIQTFYENGLTKYRLGEFESYQEARNYRKSLLKMYPDAFVQPLKNDYPIHISEALNN